MANIDSLIGLQEWVETDVIDELISSYSIATEEAFDPDELKEVAKHYGIDLENDGPYYTIEEGDTNILLFYDLDVLILMIERKFYLDEGIPL